MTGFPSSLEERGRDSLVRMGVVLQKIYTFLYGMQTVFLKGEKKCYIFK